MSGTLTAIISGSTSIVTGLISWVAGKETAKTHMQEVQATTRGPEWKAFVEEIRTQNEATKNELNAKIDDLQTQVNNLKTEVDTLNAKYVAAVSHIKHWRERHPEDKEHLTPPPEIKPDILQ